MKGILIIILVASLGMLIHNRLEAEYQRGFAEATKSILKTNPPSEELELVCAGLWIGEQNRKYFEKENRRAR